LWNFFIEGNQLPYFFMQGSYVPYLVIISYIVASFGSFTGLTLATNITDAETEQQKNWLHLGGAFVLGSSIWSMHFIGMLAYRMDMPVTYDPFLTGLSFLIAFYIAFAVLYVTRVRELRPIHISISAVLLGFAISGMHYSGMAAMKMNGDLRYTPSLFVLSILIAIAASGAALWIVFALTKESKKPLILWRVLASLIMGAAICGMHYTGMAAAVFIPYGKICSFSPPPITGNIDTESLALIIAASISVIIGLALAMALYHKERKNVLNQKRSTSFPIKLLGAALLITMGSVLWVGWYSYKVFHRVIDDPQLFNLSRHIYYSLYLTIVMAVALAVIWFFSLQNLRNWQREVTKARSDLTQRFIEGEELHAKMLQQKTFLDMLLDNMPLAILVKNAKDDYRFAMINKMAEDLLCLKEADMLGRTDYAFFPKSQSDAFRMIDEKVMTNGKVVEIEAEPVTTPKGTFTAHTLKVPIYDGSGRPHLLLIILEDVTEKIRVQSEIRLAKEQAEYANQAKSEFLANMSHELRTPLNGIIGITQLINEKEVSSEIKELFDIVKSSSESLLAIVNDILDLSKIEAKEVNLEKIQFDVYDAIHRVIQSLLPIASKKGLQVHHEIEFEKLHVTGDPLRFSRILINLISNAIRYTEEGRVTVKALIKQRSHDNALLYIEVNDTGIGIAEQHQQTIFEKFTQADSSTTRRYGGTGLGLTITRELVELMNGHIGLESELGKGTTFWFELPFEIAKNLPKRNASSASSSGNIIKINTLNKTPAKQVRILMAEDHSMNQTLMKKVFKNFGISHYTVVENGKQAVDEVKNGAFDIILMDCHMPEMNGYDATIAIRNLPDAHKKHIPIIAMTANAMAQDREKCLQIGMNLYLSKPINVSAFKDMLSQWISFE
jgi:PAS domain S-box-containing protein